MSSAMVTPQKGSTPQVGAKATNVVDATVSQRIAYLWSASQVAFTSNLPDLANYYFLPRLTSRFIGYNTRDNLIKYSESQGFAVGTDISLCTSCHSLLIPGATARVKLVPRQSLSDLNTTFMQDSADKATSIALSGPKKRKQVKNALLYTCKRCGHTLVLMGTAPLINTEKKKSSPALPHSSTPKQIPSSSFKNDAKSKFNSEVPIKTQQKAIAKDIQAKDERQRLLAAMLKSSTKQPPKKVEIAASPKKGPTPAPAKTPKKSLFNFLNSL